MGGRNGFLRDVNFFKTDELNISTVLRGPTDG